VERLRAAPVPSAYIGALPQENSDLIRPVGRGRDVERGVSGVDLVTDVLPEVLAAAHGSEKSMD
jgi:hypothetical protein